MTEVLFTAVQGERERDGRRRSAVEETEKRRKTASSLFHTMGEQQKLRPFFLLARSVVWLRRTQRVTASELSLDRFGCLPEEKRRQFSSPSAGGGRSACWSREEREKAA